MVCFLARTQIEKLLLNAVIIQEGLFGCASWNMNWESSAAAFSSTSNEVCRLFILTYVTSCCVIGQLSVVRNNEGIC